MMLGVMSAFVLASASPFFMSVAAPLSSAAFSSSSATRNGSADAWTVTRDKRQGRTRVARNVFLKKRKKAFIKDALQGALQKDAGMEVSVPA